MNIVTEGARNAVQSNTNVTALPRDGFLATVRRNLLAQGYIEVMPDTYTDGVTTYDLKIEKAKCVHYENTFNFSRCDDLLYVVSDQSGNVKLPVDVDLLAAAGWVKVTENDGVIPLPYITWKRGDSFVTFNLVDWTWSVEKGGDSTSEYRHLAEALNSLV